MCVYIYIDDRSEICFSHCLGQIWTDGELVSGQILDCPGSDPNAPVTHASNVQLKVGQCPGCVEAAPNFFWVKPGCGGLLKNWKTLEVQEIHIYQGVLEEQQVQALYQKFKRKKTMLAGRVVFEMQKWM